MRLTRAFSAALAAAFFAAGCSGGGGGGGGGNGGDPPIADAGDDAEARLYRPHALDGSQSLDPEDKPLAFTWSVLSAPDGSAVTLTSGGAAANVAFTPDTEGIYLFGLVVSDGKKSSTLDTVEVSVEMRVAVFADAYGEVAREVDLYGAGQVEDFYGWPDSFVRAAAGDVAIFLDRRLREDTLIAYRVTGGTQELLVSGENLNSVFAAGDHVVWQEYRGGQDDLFTRDLVTGEELQITSDEQAATVHAISPEFVVFSSFNAPYGYDLYLYDFASHGLTNLSDMDADDEGAAATDGDTIVFTSYAASQDVYAYDVGTQMTSPIAVSTSHNELSYGVSGDFVVLGVNTGGGTTTLYRHSISGGTRIPFEAGFGGVVAVQGDFVIYTDGADVRAYRLSTNTVTSVVGTALWGGNVSLLNGVISWTEFNLVTGLYDVKFRTLPAGAISTMANAGDALGVQTLDSGIAWDAHDGGYVHDVFFSADGGVTTDLASEDKIYLRDRVADFDVAIIGGDIDSTFGTDTIDALSAAGVPMLAFERNYGSLAGYIGSDYALFTDGGDCGTVSIRFNNSQHAAFAGFPSGSFATLDHDELDVDYNAVYIGVDEMDLPADYFPIATYDVFSGCVYDGQPAIVTFTNDDGVAVILDGAGDTYLPMWNIARRDLVISELRYLASTRAP